ncbi:FG-GAP repeat protein [Streptomyces sp. SID14515]|uniref:FG-GAP repeat protein n=1 Tax=Streptomyces sp. SID14515 TaxID=2706074 RepID=UPI0031B9EF9F
MLHGSAKGVSAAKRAVITQNSADAPGAAEEGDAFGASVAVADLNKDGRPDLVVGAAQANGQGAVWALPGGTSGQPLYTSSASFGPGSLGLRKNDWLLLRGEYAFADGSTLAGHPQRRQLTCRFPRRNWRRRSFR